MADSDESRRAAGRVSSPPENWPAVRMFLVGSLVPGSTQAVDFIDHGLHVKATQHATGERLRRHRQDLSARMRSAIRQAAGLALTVGGPYPGEPVLPIPVTDPQWPAKVQRRLRKSPGQFGITIEEVPGDTLLREVWMEERRKSSAQDCGDKA